MTNTGFRDKIEGTRIEVSGILLYFDDFEPKPNNELGRKPKFCHGLKNQVTLCPKGE